MTIKELLVKFRVQADTKAVDQVNRKVTNLRNLFLGFLSLKAASYLKSRIDDVAELGQHITVLSKAAGLGTTEYQRLAYAAQQNGITAERLGISLTRLNKQMVGAKNGTKSAVEIFARAGISRDQIKSFNTTTDALYALQDAFGNMKGPDAQARKLAVIAELFGRGAHNFLLFMDQGSDVTRKLEADAERVAAVMSENVVKEMTMLERSFLGLKRSLQTFFATLLSGVSPLLRAGIYRLQRVLGANKKRLEQNMQVFARSIVRTVGFIFGIFLGLAQKFSRLLPEAGNVFANFADNVVSAFQSILGSDGFKNIVEGIQDIWHSLSGKKFDASMFGRGIFKLDKGEIQLFSDFLIAVFKGVAERAGAIFREVWNAAVEWLKQTSPQTYEYIKKLFEDFLALFAGLKAVVKSLFDDVLVWSKAIMDWWSGKLEFISKLTGLTGQKFSDAPFFGGSSPKADNNAQGQPPASIAAVQAVSPLVSNDQAIVAMRNMLTTLSSDQATAALRAFKNAELSPSTTLPVPETRLMLKQPEKLGAPQGPRLTVPITINAPNSDPQVIARIATEKIQEWYEDRMHQAHQKTAPQVAK